MYWYGAIQGPDHVRLLIALFSAHWQYILQAIAPNVLTTVIDDQKWKVFNVPIGAAYGMGSDPVNLFRWKGK